jgi:hypothetical protein
MDVMNPTYQEVERALDLDLAKLTLTMVWARQIGYTVEPTLVATFGLDSHIVTLHLSDGDTIARYRALPARRMWNHLRSIRQEGAESRPSTHLRNGCSWVVAELRLYRRV